MSTSRILGVTLLLLFCTLVVHAQENSVNLKWYERFFDQTKDGPVDGELSALEAKIVQQDEKDDFKGKAITLNSIGLLHLTRTLDYEKAMDHFMKALAIEDSKNLKEERTFTLLSIARLFEEAGDFEQAAKYLNEALDNNADKKDDISVLVYILNRQGKVNAARGELTEAFDNYETALKYKSQLTKPLMEGETLFNIAQLYAKQGKYDSALTSHKDALTIWRSQKDRLREARSLSSIGEVYHLMKNDEKAMANHLISLKILKSLDNREELAHTYNNIGVLYFEQKNYQRAVANLQLGLSAAKASHHQREELKSYEYLSMAYTELGDYKNALTNKDLYQAIHDFLQRDKNERELVASQNRYEIGKKESEIDKLEVDKGQKEKELEEQRKFRNILILIISLVLVIIVLVLYLYMQKQRSNKQLQEINEHVKRQNTQLQQLNATKDKFFSILGHDLKGPLNSLTSFSGLLINHTDSLSKDEIRMLAKDLDKSLKNLFSLLENLLEWSRSQTGNIEFKPDNFDVYEMVEQNRELLNQQALNKNISLENIGKPGTSVYAHQHSVNTVIRNLISNAIKFTPQGGKVTLNVQPSKDEVMITVTDSGVGMDKDTMKKLFRIDTKHSTKGTADEKGTGLGLILCKDFVEKNGGQIGVESEEEMGSVFYFTVPAAKQ